jgi:Skp1 family, tetramerisation domain
MTIRYTTENTPTTNDLSSTSDSTTPSPFVTLISSDGFEFHVRRSAACVSGTIRRMLNTRSQ